MILIIFSIIPTHSRTSVRGGGCLVRTLPHRRPTLRTRIVAFVGGFGVSCVFLVFRSLRFSNIDGDQGRYRTGSLAHGTDSSMGITGVVRKYRGSSCRIRPEEEIRSFD